MCRWRTNQTNYSGRLSSVAIREFIVRWTANGYCVDFYYMIVTETLDKAKELWNEYVKMHKDIQYS